MASASVASLRFYSHHVGTDHSHRRNPHPKPLSPRNDANIPGRGSGPVAAGVCRSGTMIQGIRLDDYLPLWGLFVAMVVVILLSVEAGYRLGGYRRQHSQQEKEAPVGAMTGTTFGLLAFMLAFTFGLAASRHDTRREVLLDEANAIGTAYLRAGLLPEPHRAEIRDLLRQYVDVRLEGVQPGKLEPALRRSEELHVVLWAQAVAVAEKSPGPITGLFVQSLNEVIDLHSKRGGSVAVRGLSNPISSRKTKCFSRSTAKGFVPVHSVALPGWRDADLSARDLCHVSLPGLAVPLGLKTAML